MRYNVLTYLIGEGFSNVFKNKKQAFTSIGIMCVTMVIFGIFFAMGQNLNHFVEEIESDQGLQIYMKENATDEEITELKTKLQSLDGINTIDFVDKQAALQQLKDRFGESASLLEGYNEEVFPVSYVVTLTDLSKSSQIQEEIESWDLVDDIKSSNETINVLVKIARGIKIGTYVILVCLIAFSTFIIANTIKLTVYSRRKEISIMKYVGATNGFIRWPFAVEGMIIGLISGAISIGLLSGIYTLVLSSEAFIGFMSKLGLTLLEFGQMLNSIIIIYLVLGIGIGVLGSTLSMRKYLKV